MPIDFRSAEMQFFLRQLEKGSVVLFSGAGFSSGARNRQAQTPPLASQLAEMLCTACGWEYTGDELAIIYEQAQTHLGTRALQSFLEMHYKDCSPADWHRLIPQICWHRIYTTNIDDVIENSYASVAGQQRLDPMICPAPYEPHDLFMERVTAVHLHGCVLDLSKPLTFSLEDFARATAIPNPWYQALIEDMQVRTVCFVGTRLNEAPFHHYLALREYRSPAAREIRARAYLVSPRISRVRERQLRDQRIEPVIASAEEFFSSLSEFLGKRFPQRTEVLRTLYPHQLAALERKDASVPSELLRQFDFIKPDALPEARVKGRSLFYLGAEPTWSDIGQNVDAFRDISKSLIEELMGADTAPRCFLLAGYAGSGKTTVLMRVACELGRNGKTVYFFKGENALNPEPILALAESLEGKGAYLFIDNAAHHFETIAGMAAHLREETGLVFVLAGRSHTVYPRLPKLAALSPQARDMPELNRPDTERILEKLRQTGFLGALQGRPLHFQVSAFLVRARKQLLVALREATSGKGFDAILADEWAGLSDDQARLAYLIASLAVMHGAPGARRRHILACLDGTDLEKTRILNESLREVLGGRGFQGDLLTPRHRIIGTFVAVEVAPLEVKIDALKRLLIQISADITPAQIRRRSPEYLAYRGLINFDGMSDLFGPHYEIIVSVYDELKAYYGHDFLFWLQYGRAELEFNSFELAENYLNQSLAIRPDAHHSQHHLGVLCLKRAYTLYPYAGANEDAQKGEELLKHQIEVRGAEDPYPYNALLFHKLRYLQKTKMPDLKDQMGALYELAKIARQRHPLDNLLKEAFEQVERAYLMQAVENTVKKRGEA